MRTLLGADLICLKTLIARLLWMIFVRCQESQYNIKRQLITKTYSKAAQSANKAFIAIYLYPRTVGGGWGRGGKSIENAGNKTTEKKLEVWLYKKTILRHIDLNPSPVNIQTILYTGDVLYIV
jgi:hypothetical protein